MEITTKPFDANVLEQKLKEIYPDYFIKKFGKRMTVRKKKVTLTQQVNIVLNPEQGTVKSQTNLMMAYVFLGLGIAMGVIINWLAIFSFGLIAAYVFLKSKSINEMEKDVMNNVKQILNN